MKKTIILSALPVLMLMACSKMDDTNEFLFDTAEQVAEDRQLTNPYGIAVMREAAEKLRDNGYDIPEILPNSLYVEFTLRDSTELNILESKDVAQILNCLTSDVKTVDKLMEKVRKLK